MFRSDLIQNFPFFKCELNNASCSYQKGPLQFPGVFGWSLTSFQSFLGAESPGWRGETQSLSFQTGWFSSCCYQGGNWGQAHNGPAGGLPVSPALSHWRTWTEACQLRNNALQQPLADFRPQRERWGGTSLNAFVWCLRIGRGAWAWEHRWSWQKRHN